jgi:hypothetical protein
MRRVVGLVSLPIRPRNRARTRQPRASLSSCAIPCLSLSQIHCPRPTHPIPPQKPYPLTPPTTQILPLPRLPNSRSNAPNPLPAPHPPPNPLLPNARLHRPTNRSHAAPPANLLKHPIALHRRLPRQRHRKLATGRRVQNELFLFGE